MSLLPILLGALTVLYVSVKWTRLMRELSHIPTVGYSLPGLSYCSAIYFQWQSRKMFEDGYRKYCPGIFKIAAFDCWVVYVSGSRFIDDVRKAPEDVLSAHEALSRVLQTYYTMGPEIKNNEYHIPIVRHELTRNLDSLFDNIREEVLDSFEGLVPEIEGSDWIKVRTTETARKIVSRMTNRAIVGLPLCRNEDYINLTIEHTVDVVIVATIINLLPDFIKPLPGNLMSKIKLPKQVSRAKKHLGPIIEERLRRMAECDDKWDGKPNDFLQWLIDTADDEHRTVQDLCMRVLTINIAGIHTTSFTLIQMLYHLAANPELVGPLQEEVEGVVSSDGWSKAAVNKMKKIDSYIKEVQRVDGLNLSVLQRRTMKPFTFSNGVSVPAGVLLSCDMRDTHHDQGLYNEPDTFNPWRFSDLEKDDESGGKNQLVSTSAECLSFGLGRHACPGRFFAAMELKLVLAHIVLNYDVKFAKGENFPPNMYIGTACVSADVDLLFRRRRR